MRWVQGKGPALHKPTLRWREPLRSARGPGPRKPPPRSVDRALRPAYAETSQTAFLLPSLAGIGRAQAETQLVPTASAGVSALDGCLTSESRHGDTRGVCRCDRGRRGRACVAHKANGAGIAADPTLTDAWASFRRCSFRQAGFPSAPRHAWRPMSITVRGQSSKSYPGGAVILRRAHGDTFRVWLRHRRSRRHPALAFTRFYASTQPGLCSGAPLVSAKPRLFALCGSRPQTVAFRLPFQLPKSRTKLAVFHVASTSLLSQAIRLASGQDLRHDVSRQARGQLSTRFPVHKTLSFQCLAAPFR